MFIKTVSLWSQVEASLRRMIHEMDLHALSRIGSMLVLGIDYVHPFQKLRMELRSVGLRTRCLEVYLGSGGGQSLFEKRPTLARWKVCLSLGRVIDVWMPPFTYGAWWASFAEWEGFLKGWQRRDKQRLFLGFLSFFVVQALSFRERAYSETSTLRERDCLVGEKLLNFVPWYMLLVFCYALISVVRDRASIFKRTISINLDE